MNITRTTVVPQGSGLGGEALLLVAVLFVVGLFLGYLALLKLGIFSKSSEATIYVTPAAGKVLVELDGKPLFGNKFVSSPVKVPLQGNKEHVVTIKKLGFKDKKSVLKTPLFGGVLKETVILEKGSKPMATLRIVTTPPGARVVLDAGLGEGLSPHTFAFLPVGRNYEVVLSHPQCKGVIRERITLRAGDERMGVMAKSIRLRGCAGK